MEKYRSCPFAWLMDRGLNARAELTGIASFDSAFYGSATHRCAEELYADIARRGKIDPALREEYLGLIPAAVARAIDSLERERGIFARLVLETWAEGFADFLKKLVWRDTEGFAGYSVYGVELDLSHEYPGSSLGVHGRLDRVMEDDRGLWVVDYKTGGKFALKDFKLDPSAARLSNYQVPGYAKLAGQTGKPFCGFYMYRVKEALYKAIVAETSTAELCGNQGEPPVPLSAVPAYVAAFDAEAEAIVADAQAGKFETAPFETRKAACVNCRARPLCREHYNVR
jgi:hypothetical protein